MTFDPHPSVVLGKTEQQIQSITPLTEKIKIIEELGIDYLFIINFTTEFANLLPQEFIDQYVIGLNVMHVVAGFDFTYGRMGKGTMETLPFHSRNQFSYSVDSKVYIKLMKRLVQPEFESCLKKGEQTSFFHFLVDTILPRALSFTGINEAERLAFQLQMLT